MAPRGGPIASPAAIESARTWTRTASELGIPLTLISSDAVFTGPWMFHAETSDSFCPSTQARSLRTLETSTLEQAPQSLDRADACLRLEPCCGRTGLDRGDRRRAGIGAAGNLRLRDPTRRRFWPTDLAEILPLCWEAGLSGVYHIAGAERVNPHRFVCALARVFDLAPPQSVRSWLRPRRPRAAFGQGETSLRTRAMHRAVGRPMPMLVEGLERLLEQKNDGLTAVSAAAAAWRRAKSRRRGFELHARTSTSADVLAAFDACKSAQTELRRALRLSRLLRS